jgi:hypothetical protein
VSMQVLHKRVDNSQISVAQSRQASPPTTNQTVRQSRFMPRRTGAPRSIFPRCENPRSDPTTTLILECSRTLDIAERADMREDGERTADQAWTRRQPSEYVAALPAILITAGQAELP